MGLRRRNRTIHKDRVYLGRLIKPHALSGEIKFNPFGCDPGMLENVSPLRLESPDREVEVEYVRGSDNAPIVKFRGVDNREESQKLSGALVWTSEAGLPALEEEAGYLGHCVYHLDGPECLVHLPDICSIKGLDCIQWVHGERNKPFIEWMDLLKEIQSRGVALWIPCTPEQIPIYHRELKPNLLFYECWASNRKEGEEVLRWLERNT